MNKSQFGTREVIAVVVATALYTLISQVKFAIPTNVSLLEIALLFNNVILIVLAAGFGPISAAVGIVGAKALETVINGNNFDLLNIFIWVIVGIVIGGYYKQYGAVDGQFKGLRILDYIVVLISTNVVAFILIEPAIGFFMFKRELITMIHAGTRLAIGNVVVSGIVGSLILYIVSVVRGFEKKHH